MNIGCCTQIQTKFISFHDVFIFSACLLGVCVRVRGGGASRHIMTLQTLPWLPFEI